jgi:hypothetical protein
VLGICGLGICGETTGTSAGTVSGSPRGGVLSTFEDKKEADCAHGDTPLLWHVKIPHIRPLILIH